jgi:YfiH family protein
MLDRLTFDHGVAASVSSELEADGILVAFTERTGGVSDGPFATLNLGFTRDDPARVRQNRVRACGALDIPPFARAWQVHGAQVRWVGPGLADAGFEHPSTAIADTDGLVTDHRGVALSILTADCVPVALADSRRGIVAAVHVGWRGLASGIVAAALEDFPDARAVRAVVGPAVGPDHYEVGSEVIEAVRSTAGPATVWHRRGEASFLDLSSTIAAVLEERGVHLAERSGSCTACEPDRFFSYRRDGETGRQAMIVMRR